MSNPLFEAGLDGVTLISVGCKLLGGFYRGAGDTPRPTAILVHGLPGIEKHLDIAYRLRDLGWNCLYFHFRGCWGSTGTYSLAGLIDDTRAAMDWVASHPSVDPQRIALVAGSTGAHPAIVLGAADDRARTLVAISPVIVPGAFEFPRTMAAEFAGMLQGVSGDELLNQWQALEPLPEYMRAFAPREILVIAAGRDTIFPASQYAASVTALPHVTFVQEDHSDHGFSASRPWLVRTVTDWLVARLDA